MRTSLVALFTAASAADALRPADVSICDYYNKALLKENTAQQQRTLLTMLVNTVVVGNYTQPNVGVHVPGILAPGRVDGVAVDLLPYFDGRLKSTNTGGSQGESVNFLDGGGAEPLKKNMANDATSRQYFLLTHLYSFGSLLGCSMEGMPGFDAYNTSDSMYRTHKFMHLSHPEVTYFIQQVGLAAASFGVDKADVDAVGSALDGLFNFRCSPPTAVIASQAPQLQSICIDPATCPLHAKVVCDRYETPMEPKQGSDSMAPHHGTAVGPSASGRPCESRPTSGSLMPNGSVSVSAVISGAPLDSVSGPFGSLGKPTGVANTSAAAAKLSNVCAMGAAMVLTVGIAAI